MTLLLSRRQLLLGSAATALIGLRDDGDAPARVPMTLADGTLTIPATVNGKAARFIVDTGANISLVTPAAAARLGLRAIRPADADAPDSIRVKAYGGDAMLARTEIAELRVGTAATASRETAYLAPLPAGLNCDGVLGAAFLRRFVVGFDWDAGRLTLTAPDRFKAPADAVAVPLRLDHDLPHVEATLGGARGWFLLDSGANDAVTVYGPFTERNRLRERYPKRVPTVGRGLGGLIFGEIVRVPELGVGGLTLPGVLAELPRDAADPLRGDPDHAGGIGTQVLRRIALTLDYVNKKAYLAKTRGFAAPFAGPRSGLLLDNDDSRILVVGVAANSPASEAGLSVGDRLLEIDGASVTQLSGGEISARLRAAPGTVVPLLVRIGKTREARRVSLTLRDLL